MLICSKNDYVYSLCWHLLQCCTDVQDSSAARAVNEFLSWHQRITLEVPCVHLGQCVISQRRGGFRYMFGRTRTPTKNGLPQAFVGQQRDIIWPVESLWRVATFKSSLGAARHSLIWGGGYSVHRVAKSENYVTAPQFTEQGLICCRINPAVSKHKLRFFIPPFYCWQLFRKCRIKVFSLHVYSCSLKTSSRSKYKPTASLNPHLQWRTSWHVFSP